ncbi:hypothetical protein [Herbiconiux sp. UC225_62]|uniref:hypothetical protein n=1 Tax=Herbiconiux sp. UC225_62 TaxID=3350168 RepID=UPI0036D3DF56
MPRRTALPPELRHDSFTVAHGRASGVGEKRMRGADLSRPFRGVRSAGSDRASFEGRCNAYALILRPGEYFSHVTAARIWDAPLPRSWSPAEAVHVSIPAPGRAARGALVRGHQLSDPGLRSIVRSGLPVSDPATTWLLLAATLGHDALVAVGDYLVRVPPREDARRHPHIELETLLSRVEESRCWGIARARRAIVNVREGADSPQETFLRLALVRAGLPEPELNVEIPRADGSLAARVDMFYRDQGVVVEYDGDQHRTDAAQYDRDISRIDELYRLGLAVVRIRDPQMRGAAAPAVQLVARALRTRGWRSPAKFLPPDALKPWIQGRWGQKIQEEG